MFKITSIVLLILLKVYENMMKSDLRATLRQLKKLPKPKLRELIARRVDSGGPVPLWWDSFDESAEFGLEPAGLVEQAAGEKALDVDDIDALEKELERVKQLFSEG